jgi:hypothetical protein
MKNKTQTKKLKNIYSKKSCKTRDLGYETEINP